MKNSNHSGAHVHISESEPHQLNYKEHIVLAIRKLPLCRPHTYYIGALKKGIYWSVLHCSLPCHLYTQS